jgi:hypothetical protein
MFSVHVNSLCNSLFAVAFQVFIAYIEGNTGSDKWIESLLDTLHIWREQDEFAEKIEIERKFYGHRA